MRVPFNDLSRAAARDRAELMALLERVVVSGRYILDTEVAAFEQAFASFVGATYAVGVNSGTDALALALRALGVGHGDEVITVANTATATVAAIRMAGGIPVFADIDDSHTMDPRDLERRINAKTKVIMPVHLYGFPADMEAIKAIAGVRNIFVLEDAAQAHGATIADVPVGKWSDIAAFSFYPTKNLGALGDGGAIVTDSEDLATRMRRLRVYGERERYDSIEEGVNSRLDEMQAAILTRALKHLPARNARRAEIAEKYRAHMRNPAAVLPEQSVGERQGVWHLFVVQVEDRERFRAHMKKANIGTAIHYPKPIYRHEAYAFLNVDPKHYPMTEKIVPRIVSLPLFPELTDEEIEAVIVAVNAYKA